MFTLRQSQYHKPSLPAQHSLHNMYYWRREAWTRDWQESGKALYRWATELWSKVNVNNTCTKEIATHFFLHKNPIQLPFNSSTPTIGIQTHNQQQGGKEFTKCAKEPLCYLVNIKNIYKFSF